MCELPSTLLRTKYLRIVPTSLKPIQYLYIMCPGPLWTIKFGPHVKKGLDPCLMWYNIFTMTNDNLQPMHNLHTKNTRINNSNNDTFGHKR